MCGVSQPTINRLLNGETENPPYIYELAKALETSVKYLKTGAKEESEKVPTEIKNSQEVRPMSHSFKEELYNHTVPVYGPTRGGFSDIIKFTKEHIVGTEEAPPALKNVDGGRGLLVVKDNMEPAFFKGARAWVHPFKPCTPENFCVIILKEGRNAILKRYMGETDNEIKLMTYKPEKHFSMKKSEIAEIYKVVGQSYD